MYGSLHRSTSKVKAMIEKVGIQTFTIRKQLKPVCIMEEALRYYAGFGITSFELSRINFNQSELIVLNKLKKELGLVYTASQITLHKIKSDFDFIMKFNKELGIKYLEVSVIPFMSFIRGKKGILSLSRDLNNLGKRTREHNINLLFHHHNFELIKFEDKISLDLMIEHTDAEVVNYVCDTYWLAKSGYNPAKFIENRISRIKGVHLRDNLLKFKLGRFITTDTTLGNGTIDFSKIIKLDDYNQIDFYSIEQDSECPSKDIERSYSYLKSLVK